MNRYFTVKRLHRQPGQVVENRLVQVDLALLVKLQDHYSDKAFGDRADLEQMRGSHWRFCGEVRVTVSTSVQSILRAGESQRQAGRVHRRQIAVDESIKLPRHPSGSRSGAGITSVKGPRCTR